MPKFDVTYCVTREETYRVVAQDKEEAEDIGFTDGELVDTGETTNVTPGVAVRK